MAGILTPLAAAATAAIIPRDETQIFSDRCSPPLEAKARHLRRALIDF